MFSTKIVSLGNRSHDSEIMMRKVCSVPAECPNSMFSNRLSIEKFKTRNEFLKEHFCENVNYLLEDTVVHERISPPSFPPVKDTSVTKETKEMSVMKETREEVKQDEVSREVKPKEDEVLDDQVKNNISSEVNNNSMMDLIIDIPMLETKQMNMSRATDLLSTDYNERLQEEVREQERQLQELMKKRKENELLIKRELELQEEVKKKIASIEQPIKAKPQAFLQDQLPNIKGWEPDFKAIRQAKEKLQSQDEPLPLKEVEVESEEDLSFFDRISDEDLLTLKKKYIEHGNIMKELYPMFDPKLSLDQDIKTIHKSYNKSYDEINVYEDVRELKIIIVIVWLMTEGFMYKYISFIDVDGFCEYMKEFKSNIDEYIKLYCLENYNYSKKMNRQKAPDKISFYDENKNLVVIDISIGESNKELNDVAKPSLYNFTLQIAKTTLLNFLGFLVNNKAKDWIPDEALANNFVNWVNGYIKTWTSTTKRYDETQEETFGFLAPIVTERITTKVFGIDVLYALENHGAKVKGLLFTKASAEPTPEPKTISIGRRTPRTRVN